MNRLTDTLTRILCAMALLFVVGGLAACDDTTEEPGEDTSTAVDTTTTEDDTSVTPDTEDDTSTEPDQTTEPETTEPDVTEPDTAETTEPDTTTETDATVEDVDAVEEVDTPPGCGFGSIRGRVCSPRGDEWLSDVQVTVSAFECDNTPIVLQDFTDSQGFFVLENVPEGTHSVKIETGSFTNTIQGIVVEPGKETDLTSATTKLCLDSRSAKIAVITGVFDHIELLLDGLGIIYDLYAGDFILTQYEDPFDPDGTIASGLDLLLDRQALLQYDIVIINSGQWFELFANYPVEDTGDNSTNMIFRMRGNIAAFVQNGGSLYVSDWAAYWIETVYPGAIQFFGDPGNDAMGQPQIGPDGPAKIGALDPDVPATVETEIFRNVVGDNMTINFNWTAWVVATSVSFESEVHVLATEVSINDQSMPSLSNVPLVVSYQPTQTSGAVFFSAFHAAVQPTQQMEDVLKRIIFQL